MKKDIILNMKNGYRIGSLSIDSSSAVEKLCEKCADYFILVEGVIPSPEDVKGILIDLPPDKSNEDKFVLGIFRLDNKLVGIIDIIKDYPTTGEWMLGLMLIDPEERSNGLGTAVHKELSEWVSSLGAESIRIGVIQDNDKANKFWSHLGYIKVKDIDMSIGDKTHVVDVMRLPFYS